MTKARDTADINSGTNTAAGEDALENNTASNNTAVGYQSLFSNVTHTTLTAVGYQALYNNTADDNTAVGWKAMFANTTGSLSVAVGRSALEDNTTGGSNTALGYSPLSNNSTGSNNVAIGRQALLNNTTASDNVALGYQALYANTTGTPNVAVGKALGTNTTGGNNIGIGFASLNFNTTGSQNVAMGRDALRSNTTASNNTAVGYQAGYSNTTSGYNTFIGQTAGYSTTGVGNTFIGCSDNSVGAGYFVTTGTKNTIIGGYHGNQGGLDIRTSSNNIVLSDGDGNPRGYYKSQWVFNSDAASLNAMILRNTSSTTPYLLNMSFSATTPNNTTSEFLACGDPSVFRLKIFSNGNVVNSNNSYGSISDVKLKENIVDASSQWDDIKALTVRKYSMKADALDAPNMLGVIAQEVESAGMGGLVFESPDRDTDNNDLGTVTKQVNYSILYMKAVKALQEAMTRIETLETKVTALEG